MLIKEVVFKAWRLVVYFILVKKVWQKPLRREILIYDAAHEGLLKHFLGEWEAEVLHLSGEQINLRVMFRCLFSRGRIFYRYVDQYISYVQPKLIVTMIDNRLDFYFLKQRHLNIKTLFIQNGIRDNHFFYALNNQKIDRGVLEVNYMMVFGKGIANKYLEYIKGTTLNFGSFKNNFVPIKRLEKRTDVIAFISQYRELKQVRIGNKIISGEEYIDSPTRVVLKALKAYALSIQKKILIVLYSGYFQDAMLEREKSYYSSLLGNDCELEFSTWENYKSSYETLDAVDVAVSIDSTLAYESAARGNKTAFFSIRGSLLGEDGYQFGWPNKLPDKGKFWASTPTQMYFNEILDYLFDIDATQWLTDLEEIDFSSMLCYQAGNTALLSTITSILEE